MLVRVNVKSVGPTKSSGGREAVEGATLKAKSGLCAVVEAEGVEKVVDEVVYVVVVEFHCIMPCCWYMARMYVVVELGTVIVWVCPPPSDHDQNRNLHDRPQLSELIADRVCIEPTCQPNTIGVTIGSPSTVTSSAPSGYESTVMLTFRVVMVADVVEVTDVVVVVVALVVMLLTIDVVVLFVTVAVVEFVGADVVVVELALTKIV
jgi:hypothetical protein